MCIFYARKGKSMKHNKILGVLSIAAALTLVACGGKATSGAKTSKKPTATSKAPVSREPVPTATVSAQTLEKRTDGKVYFKVTGTVANYADGALKWAWGLADNSGTFVYGKEAPAAADFTALAFDATTKAFSTEFCISDIADIPTGVYHIYGGDKADTYAEIAIEDSEFQARDTRYDYFIRTDQSASGIAIEDLGPFAIQSGDFVKDPDADHTGIYLKLGGAQATAPVQATIDAWNTKCDFQRMSFGGGYKKNALNDFFWKIEGTNLFIYMSVAEMTGGEAYMTHLSANMTGAGDPGKALGSVNFDVEKSFEADNLKFRVLSDTSMGQKDGDEHFYGAIGVYCDFITQPETPEDPEVQ